MTLCVDVADPLFTFWWFALDQLGHTPIVPVMAHNWVVKKRMAHKLAQYEQDLLDKRMLIMGCETTLANHYSALNTKGMAFSRALGENPMVRNLKNRQVNSDILQKVKNMITTNFELNQLQNELRLLGENIDNTTAQRMALADTIDDLKYDTVQMRDFVNAREEPTEKRDYQDIAASFERKNGARRNADDERKDEERAVHVENYEERRKEEKDEKARRKRKKRGAQGETSSAFEQILMQVISTALTGEELNMDSIKTNVEKHNEEQEEEEDAESLDINSIRQEARAVLDT